MRVRRRVYKSLSDFIKEVQVTECKSSYCVQSHSVTSLSDFFTEVQVTECKSLSDFFNDVTE